MSYVIKDGTGATQTVEADTVGGAIQPVSSPVDANGNHMASAPGVGNTNAALAVQGVPGGVAVPVSFPTTQTVSITAAQLPSVAAQGSTTAGQSGGLEMGAVSTTSPSWTNGQTQPLSLTLAGALRVDGSTVTQPVNYAMFVGNTPLNGGQGGLMGVGGAVASGSANSGVNPVKIGGVFNTTQPTVSNGQIVDAQLTPRGAQIVAIGTEGFAPTIAQQPTADALAASNNVASANMLFNGSSWDRQRSAPGTTGVVPVDSESTKATYSATVTLSATGLGDIMMIQGSNTKTVKIKKVILYNFASAAGVAQYCLVRRSSASGGTTTFANVGRHDLNDPVPTATVTAFSATGAVGTSVAILSFARSSVATTTTAGLIAWDFSRNNDKAIVLRGTSDFLALNFTNGGVEGTATHDITIEWTEE